MDNRLTKTPDPAREGKAAQGMQGKSIDNTRKDRDEFLSKFRTEMFTNVLPKLPEIPGYHICWLSTTNQYDTIQYRQSIGYEIIRPEEIPGYDHVVLKDGRHQGCIGINEMVAAKIPMELYLEFMRIAHHERPNEEQMKLKDTARFIREAAAGEGLEVYIEQGLQEANNEQGSFRPRQPIFDAE